MEGNQIRTLFSRNHDTVFSKLGVFLGGPTPPSGQMQNGWRRVITEKLKNDNRLDPSMIIVSPEPESGDWEDIDNPNPSNELENVRDKQMPWEIQYLNLCDITTFWLPTYWDPPVIGSSILPYHGRSRCTFLVNRYFCHSSSAIIFICKSLY